MDLAWTASCPDCVSLTPIDPATLVFEGPGGRLELPRLSPVMLAALTRLRHPGARLADLAAAIAPDGGGAGARLFAHIQHLLSRGLIEFSVGGLISAAPMVGWFGTAPPEATKRPHLLSRFAYLRRTESRLVIESPLAFSRLELLSPTLAALPFALATPAIADDLPARLPGLSSDLAAAVFRLLLAAGFLTPVDEHGQSAEDADEFLGYWEFHDLAFHARAREGRHDYPRGATYHMVGITEPPPPIKPPLQGKTIVLSPPSAETPGPSFAEVVERRRSIRDYSAEPITLAQLSEFLYRVARIKSVGDFTVETETGPYTMTMTHRPYPAAGGLYELELYPVVNSCVGLERGLYHYDASGHRLVRVAPMSDTVSVLISDAAGATGIEEDQIQVVLVVAARFARLSWKYSSIAYALTLKNVGVLYELMYLTATAMGLSPCGIGCGDAELFAQVIGQPYHVEGSVGEFMLGGRPAESPKQEGEAKSN